MQALLEALDRWGPATAYLAAAAALIAVIAAFGLGVAHGTASPVAYAGAVGVLVLIVALGYQALRRGAG
jgi:hypothetical protein